MMQHRRSHFFWYCTLVLLAYAPAVGSHGLEKDAHRKVVIADSPSAWWTLDSSASITCLACAHRGADCLPEQWCRGSAVGFVTSTTGISGGAIARSAVFQGIGGLIIPMAWMKGYQALEISVELFVRLSSSAGFEEQTVVGGGSMRICDGVGRRGCPETVGDSVAATGGFEIVVHRVECSSSSSCEDRFMVGARVQMTQGGDFGALVMWGRNSLKAGDWHHIVLTINSHDARIYANASMFAEVRVDGGIPWNGEQMRVGMCTPGALTGGYLKGDVDELAVYTHILTQVGSFISLFCMDRRRTPNSCDALMHVKCTGCTSSHSIFPHQVRMAQHYASVFHLLDVAGPHSECSRCFPCPIPLVREI